MSSLKKLSILLLILLLPSIAYLLMTTGKNNYKTLLVFGEKSLSESGDTIYHKVPDFAFANQNGDTIRWKNYEDKIVVADFFFTRCGSICPQMTMQLVRVQEKFKAERSLKIVSFTVDPEADSVEVLKAYAKRFMVKDAKWNLLTGNKNEIYSLGVKGFLLPTQEDALAPGGFLHSEYLVLLDKDRRIRGFYDGTSKLSVDTLMDEIMVLLQEYHQ